MITTIFLPVFIIIAVIFFVITSSRRRQVKREVIFDRNKMKWLLGSYISILVIAAIVVNYISIEQSAPQKEDIDFYTMAIEGKIDQVDPVYIESKDEWEYDKEELYFASAYYGVPIVVERKEANDQLIEVVTYRGQFTLAGVDYTEYMNPIRTKLLVDTLTIMEPDYTDLQFAAVIKEFTITQFMDERERMREIGSNHGNELIYIRIPKEMNFIHEDPHGYIQYVENNV